MKIFALTFSTLAIVLGVAAVIMGYYDNLRKETPPCSTVVHIEENDDQNMTDVYNDGKLIEKKVSKTRFYFLNIWLKEQPSVTFESKIPNYKAGSLQVGDKVTVKDGEVVAVGCDPASPK